MGGCLVRESPCFVEVELGTRVIGARQAVRGLGRRLTGKLMGFLVIYMYPSPP